MIAYTVCAAELSTDSVDFQSSVLTGTDDACVNQSEKEKDRKYARTYY